LTGQTLYFYFKVVGFDRSQKKIGFITQKVGKKRVVTSVISLF
jgi:hypothetical protein